MLLNSEIIGYKAVFIDGYAPPFMVFEYGGSLSCWGGLLVNPHDYNSRLQESSFRKPENGDVPWDISDTNSMKIL